MSGPLDFVFSKNLQYAAISIFTVLPIIEHIVGTSRARPGQDPVNQKVAIIL
jgi:hypothetical protein